MTDQPMTVERAREIVTQHENHAQRMTTGRCFNPDCSEAKGFLKGHASREKEIEGLKKEIDELLHASNTIRKFFEDQSSLQADLAREREKVKELVAAARFFKDVFDLGSLHDYHPKATKRLDDALAPFTPAGIGNNTGDKK